MTQARARARTADHPEERTVPLEIPEVVIDRLPVYARALSALQRQGREVVNSQELGERLGVTPAQIRKDLSYFGRFGKQGRGYNVGRLLEELRQILGLTREWSMVLVGVGRLGRAIVGYAGFAPQGFRIIEAFDADPQIVGTKIDGLVVKDVSTLPDVLRRKKAQLAIVAVPGSSAQEVIDMLVSCGIKAILNYAPIAPQAPPDVHIKDIDPVLALQSMTFYIKGQDAQAK
ncbi:MAG: redox-sensing transcriptional repressor Rex [Dehalococcoidia bacterium]|nr:redox-sensing transcriptional repressor Rex [Dehalococcoidia bacterium]